MDYKVKTRYVTATPRKARKGLSAEASATSSSGGGGAYIGGGGATSADAHAHANLDTLNQLDTTPADGYLYLDTTDTDSGETIRTKVKAGFADSADHATNADRATNATEAAHAAEATHATEATHADEAAHADKATHADEATHAATADDLTNWGTADQRYLSRQHDDTAEGSVTFRKAARFEASAQSPNFVSQGFEGSGWAARTADDGQTYIEADNLRIRGTLTAFELVIEKIRAICGALGISQACGRVKSVTEDATNYYLILEGDDTHGYGGFMANDYIRCQRWTSNGARGYWVKVSAIGNAEGGHNNVLTINKSEFDAAIVEPKAKEVDTYDHTQTAPHVVQLATDDLSSLITTDDGTTELLSDDSDTPIAGQMVRPEVGDELVQYGNATDTTRQSAIYIHANGTGQPAIDLLTGITAKSFVGCLACRLGGYLPTGGFGLYTKNGQVVSLSPDGQTTHYSLNPDGTFSLGQGAIYYNGKVVTVSPNVQSSTGAWSMTADGRLNIKDGSFTEYNSARNSTLSISTDKKPIQLSVDDHTVFCLFYDAGAQTQSAAMELTSYDNSLQTTIFANGINLYEENVGTLVLSSSGINANSGGNQFRTGYIANSNKSGNNLRVIMKGLTPTSEANFIRDALMAGDIIVGSEQTIGNVVVRPLYVKVRNK